jgi:hypothetical protein
MAFTRETGTEAARGQPTTSSFEKWQKRKNIPTLGMISPKGRIANRRAW